MKNFFSAAYKTFTGLLSIVGAFAILLFFTETGWEENTYMPDSASTQAWLKNMENEEEENFKASMVKEMCASKHKSDEAWCTGYTVGFTEGHHIAGKRLFCTDGEFSSDQIKQSFKNFMEDNPQHWGKYRSAVLGAALQETFPCD